MYELTGNLKPNTTAEQVSQSARCASAITCANMRGSHHSKDISLNANILFNSCVVRIYVQCASALNPPRISACPLASTALFAESRRGGHNALKKPCFVVKIQGASQHASMQTPSSTKVLHGQQN